jgi:RHS repeat-associated protein
MHAVTGTGNGNSYGYDANGNQTSRTIGGVAYTLIYDAENRLITVKQGSTTIASFTYDGDGNRIKSTIGSVTTIFIGSWFEWTGSTSTMVKYYYAGAPRVAMRVGSGSTNSSVKWLLGDHLGSTSLTTNYDGASPVTQLYKPWGEVRYSSGSLPTSYTYTGQYSNSYIKLIQMGARWYDPAIGRFISADTIIPAPGEPIAWDRYHYAKNSPKFSSKCTS